MYSLCSRSIPGVILGQNCVGVLDANFHEFFFFENLFYQKQCKYAMKLGVAQTRGELYSFFNKKLSYLEWIPYLLLLYLYDVVLVVYSTLSLTVDNWGNIFWCPRVFCFNLFLALDLVTSLLANKVPSSIM